MHDLIVGVCPIDKQGRINIAKILDKVPQRIVVAINATTKEIQIIDFEEENNTVMTTQKIDGKGRIFIPAWIRKEILDKNWKIYIVLDEEKKPHLFAMKEAL